MKIRPQVSAWCSESTREYHTFICAAGYESRSVYIAEHIRSSARRCVAVGFDYHHTCSLDKNVSWLSRNGFFDWNDKTPCFASDSVFSEIISKLFEAQQFSTLECLHLAVDISSFSSSRLAMIVQACWKLSTVRDVKIDFLYSPGRGYDPTNSTEQIEFAGPVNDKLAGWSSEPEMPVVAIFCLGQEYDRAIGAFEYLNPSLTYTFSTHGADEALNDKIRSYTAEDSILHSRIQEANRQLFPLVPPELRFRIDLSRPLDCYSLVRSVAMGAMRRGRVVFVPLGPKLFSLSAIAIANEFYPRIAVWRISTGRKGAPCDVEARGEIVGLQFSLHRV